MEEHLLSIAGDPEEVNTELYRDGMTDGLPVVPPTPERVEEMLGGTSREADAEVGVIPPRYGTATVETVAVNAVMAGAKPGYMPVILAAVDAMTAEPFNLYGVNATTHPVAPLVLVNGPVADEQRINSGYNVFGQGWRANATIGRTVRLLLLNAGGGDPGGMDRATHGHPGKFSYCIAENEQKNPWDPLHVQRGYDADESTVTVFAADAPHEINDHVSDDAHGVLMVTADVLSTLGNNNAYLTEAEALVVFGPEHAATIADSGWSREDVQWYLYDQARTRVGRLKHAGMYDIRDWNKRFDLKDDDDRVPIVETPEDFVITVAGGAGKHSMAIHSMGGMTRSVTTAVADWR